MILHATILAAFVALYVIAQAVIPSKFSWSIKLLLGIMATLAAFKFHIFYLIEGQNFFTPNLPQGVIWVGCWLFCAVIAFTLLMAAADIVRLPLYWFLRLKKSPFPRWRWYNNLLNLILLLTALGVCAWGTWCGIKAPDIRTVNVEISGLPAGALPIRLVQLTDLHADSTKDADFYRDIVQRTNALHPDVVVITGDMADSTVKQKGSALVPLRDLNTPMGVYAVTGNHDFFWGKNSWINHLTAQGITFIDNKVVHLKAETESGKYKELCLIGLPDPMGRHNGTKQAELSQLVPKSEQKSAPVVLLSHQPRIAKQAAKHAIDLQLSGHTHGGQFPGLKSLVARMNNGYVHGLYRVGNMKLYVSAGTSLWTPICLRLGVPAEITLINLIPAEQK